MISIFKFASQLFGFLILAISIHIGVLYLKEFSLFDNMILTSYGVNYILAIGIYALMFKLKETQPNNIGFLFMAGSLVKFGVFFLVFYPPFKNDGEMSSLEFSSFFVPYIICLVVETIALANLLINLKD